MVFLGYLTEHQRAIWKHRQQSLTQSEIGKLMGISRQAIHRIFSQIDEKLERALLEAARLNRITPTHKVDSTNGILFGYSETLRMDSLIAYHPNLGIQLWYEYEGDCSRCQYHDTCREALKDLCSMHQIPLSEGVSRIETNKMAQNIFQALKHKTFQKSETKSSDVSLLRL